MLPILLLRCFIDESFKIHSKGRDGSQEDDTMEEKKYGV